MSLTKRIVAIAVVVLLLSAITPNWRSSLQDYSPTPVVLGFLLAMCLLFYLVRFTALEVLVVIIVCAPALYLAFHTLCGYPAAEAFLQVALSALALVLFFLISSLIGTFSSKSVASILRPLAAACIPFLWAFVLIRQSVLFPLAFTILIGLFWFYRRSSKNRG